MAQQTSVDWLEERLTLSLGDEIKYLRGFFVIAKEMHEVEMHKCASFWRGKENHIEKPIFNEYYKETFNK
jgi:hypothetical protein